MPLTLHAADLALIVLLVLPRSVIMLVDGPVPPLAAAGSQIVGGWQPVLY